MIDSTQLAGLTPTQRAQLIYQHAHAELAQGLWRAALGDGEKRDNPFTASNLAPDKAPRLDALLVMLNDGVSGAAPEIPTPVPAQVVPASEPQAAPAERGSASASLRAEALGANARFADAINRAADRTGLPASALASILDAEAGRGKDGAWNVHSRNPRSSAAGLGQFLSGTWEGEAERPGTWLNGEARRRGWLNDAGQVAGNARGSLLALRYDPEASIQATADYAHGNLQRLERAGVRVGGSVEDIARMAYLGHHLGPGDASRFLGGGLDPARARHLLAAQVGSASAARRVADAGNATDAHRQWLNTYVGRRIDPGRFG